MRTIKFRGRAIDDGRWVYGFYAEVLELDKNAHMRPWESNSSSPFVKQPRIYTHGGSWFVVDPNTVGQYTELRDKNGTPIFSGDLIKVGNVRNTYVFEVKHKVGGEWFDEYHGEGINSATGYFLPDYLSKPYTIIGNIYEHPTLLQ